MQSHTLAIDFGTTRTKVASYDERRQEPRLIELGRDVRSVVPSVFYVPKTGAGEVLVGDDAQQMEESDPGGLVIGLKRELHRPGKKHLGEDRPALDRIDLAAELFQSIRRRCEQQVFRGQPVANCRLTVPSAFTDGQRECLRQAAERGGFRNVTLIEEPVAAAMAWLIENGSAAGDRVVVCDIGGGTTDFAVVRISNGRCSPEGEVAPDGIERGVNDVDRSIWDKILENQGADREALETRSAGFLLKIRRVRELLGSTRSASFPIKVDGVGLEVPRELFDEEIRKFVAEIQKQVERFLEKCRQNGLEGDFPILLVGGGTGAAGLKDAVQSLNGDRVFQWNQSEYAVALGAVQIPPTADDLPQKQQQWEEYADAVKACLTDGRIRKAAARKVSGAREKLGVTAKEAQDIERHVIGRTLEEVLHESSLSPERVLDLISDGALNQAIELTTSAMLESPTDAAFDLWCEVAYLLPSTADALVHARKVCEQRGNDIWGACCLAVAFKYCGRNEDLQTVLGPHLNGKWNASYPLLLAAELDFQPEQVQNLARLAPTDAGRANSAVHQAQIDGARTGSKPLLDQVVQRYPRCVWARVMRSIAAAWAGDSTVNIGEDLQFMQRVSPLHPMTALVHAVFAITGGDYTSAISKLDHALTDSRIAASAEWHSLCLYLKAMCRRSMQDSAGALSLLNGALQVAPDFSVARVNRARLLLDAGNPAEALTDIDYVLTREPEATDLNGVKGWCQFWLGQTQQALDSFGAAAHFGSVDPQVIVGGVLCSIICAAQRAGVWPSATYVWPNIPQDKLKAAAQSYVLPHRRVDASRVLLLYDDTFFGGSKDGFCITDEAIYWHNQWEQNVFHYDLTGVTRVDVAGRQLAVNGNQISVNMCDNASVLRKMVSAAVQFASCRQGRNQQKQENESHACEVYAAEVWKTRVIDNQPDSSDYLDRRRQELGISKPEALKIEKRVDLESSQRTATKKKK